jgi:hypothetical protein
MLFQVLLEFGERFVGVVFERPGNQTDLERGGFGWGGVCTGGFRWWPGNAGGVCLEVTEQVADLLLIQIVQEFFGHE